MMTAPRQELVAALREPKFYPHPVGHVEIRETHISSVALAGEFVYKIKKPLDLGFLDFTTLEKRHYYCRQEVALNRRLSRDVYLEVVAIARDEEGGYRLDGPGPVVEYAVKMRRLPDEAAMGRMLRAGRLNEDAVSGLARRLARFHAEARRDGETAAVGAWETVRRNCEENFSQVEPYADVAVDRRSLTIIRAATRAFLHRRKALFDRRVAGGYIRDGHGDLRSDHIYFHQDDIQVIDCIEFNDRFRFGDVAVDLAFLAMDLDAIGFPKVADAFLTEYVAATGDGDLYTLIDFYKCYRAMVRVKVSCFRLDQIEAAQRPPLELEIRRHQEMAFGYALRYTRPLLWVVCGLPASGKSTMAEALAKHLDVAVLQSDVVRKALFGRKALDSQVAPHGEGIYSKHATGLTYGRLLLLAQEQLAQGRSIVLDATFAGRRQRQEVTRLADDTDAGVIFIECVCPDETLKARLTAREGRPGVSDARRRHFEQFKAGFEPLDELPPEQHLRVDTQAPMERNLPKILAAAERAAIHAPVGQTADPSPVKGFSTRAATLVKNLRFAFRRLFRQPYWAVFLVLLCFAEGLRAESATFSWLEDARNALEVEDVRDLPQSAWHPFDTAKGLNLGYSDSSFWLRVDAAPTSVNRLLAIEYPLLDEVRVYWVRQGRVIQTYITGDSRAFGSRPLTHRHFLFPVPLADEPVSAFARIQTKGSVQVPARVIAARDFMAQDQVAFGWQAVFAGLILAMVLYNLFLFIAIRQAAYLWYVLTVIASGLVQLNFHGLPFQWLWPGWPVLNLYFTTWAIAAHMAFASLFTMSFLELRRYSPASHRFFQLVLALCAFGCLFGWFGSYRGGIMLVTILTTIVTPAAWLIGVRMWRKGQALAGFYVLAWTPLLVSHMILAISKMGYMPSSPIIEFFPQAGVAIEVILLSFALAYRINLERRRRQQAQEQALEVQRQANQNLEARVRERTEELEKVNHQLHAMTLTDGLTRVANRRRFDEQLPQEWRRAQRQNYPLSLLILDIDYFKKVNDELGHLVGDDCLVSMASLCAQNVYRPGDLLARYGGEEFSVLLPNTPAEGALRVADRLRLAVDTKPVHAGERAEPIRLTISVGVATMTPSPGEVPAEMIRRADEALYAAKNAGRNRVVVWEKRVG